MEAPLRLVVVDDEMEKRFLLVHVLRNEFAEAEIVEYISGAEVIAHLERNEADAVITNHKMFPVNGVELTRWIRANRGNLPIVMVTSSGDIAQSAKEAGASRVLDFWDYRQLGSVVRALLENRRDPKS